MKRRAFNSLGYPKLPSAPTLSEVARWLEDMSISEQLQPKGHDMDAREWAAVCLRTASEDLRAIAKRRAGMKTPDPKCPYCDGTGLMDTGGQTPWGSWISLPCSCLNRDPKCPKCHTRAAAEGQE